ncbi:MAG: hypothetical protein ACHP7P_02315 [Terriglobales bacterium]
MPVRFEPDDLKLITAAARVANRTISEWVRDTIRTAAELYLFNGTLHEAMRSVLLRRKNFTATTSEISEEIEQNGLYTRKDGEPARAKQVNSRVRQYPALFEFVAPGIVRLVGNSSAKPEAVKAVLGQGDNSDLDFRPVEIGGEPLSATILRERR